MGGDSRRGWPVRGFGLKHPGEFGLGPIEREGFGGRAEGRGRSRERGLGRESGRGPAPVQGWGDRPRPHPAGESVE